MKISPNNIDNIKFDNSFSRLPNKFYVNVKPTPVKSPNLIKFNKILANDLGINLNAKECNDFFKKNLKDIRISYCLHRNYAFK